MELELKITCTCHQANTAICCQIPLVAQINCSKNLYGGVFHHAGSKFAIIFVLRPLQQYKI